MELNWLVAATAGAFAVLLLLCVTPLLLPAPPSAVEQVVARAVRDMTRGALILVVPCSGAHDTCNRLAVTLSHRVREALGNDRNVNTVVIDAWNHDARQTLVHRAARKARIVLVKTPLASRHSWRVPPYCIVIAQASEADAAAIIEVKGEGQATAAVFVGGARAVAACKTHVSGRNVEGTYDGVTIAANIA